MGPKLKAATLRARREGAQPEAGCGRCVQMLLHKNGHFNQQVCADVFDLIDIDNSESVSIDELERFLLYFNEEETTDQVGQGRSKLYVGSRPLCYCLG